VSQTRDIHQEPDVWRLVIDDDPALAETDDYMLAEGGVVKVTDARADGEHVSVDVYPESGSSAYLSITADEALSLGQWLVKTFGSKP
jgi:hypothetical protein